MGSAYRNSTWTLGVRNLKGTKILQVESNRHEVGSGTSSVVVKNKSEVHEKIK